VPTVRAHGLAHHVVDEGKGPLVLLLHGFPESSHAWRHQVRALAAAGYRAVAPDVRGYGATDAPAEVKDYRLSELVADAAGIVEALGETQAVVVGHDWGASIAWECARMRPEVFRAVAAMSVPLTPRPPAPPTSILAKRFFGSFFYMLYFQEPGVAERELEADVRRSLRLIYYGASGDTPSPGLGFAFKAPGAGLLEGMIDPPVLPAWWSEGDLDVLAASFRRSGFRGPLHRYRAMDLDWVEGESAADRKVEVPALFVAGDRDMTVMLASNALERMKDHVPNLRRSLIIPGAGHWIGEERPEEVNAALLGFLATLGSSV
jgi:pimeloyl-ACP methyl ester carboxylesterase